MMRAALLALAFVPHVAAADTFVLVHGAWTGDYYWDALIPELTAAGHTAFAVSLTGQGARISEGGPQVSVEDHIADITAAIEAAHAQTGEKVILVAHSYGGRPATGAWDRARDHIAHLVWIEAVVPLDDSPLALPNDGESLAFVVTMYPDIADSGMFPPSPTLREEPGRPLAPMSLRALYGPVTVDAPLPRVRGTYIHAEDSSLPVLRQYGEHIAQRLGWTLASVPGGHDVMADAPDQIRDALLWVADQTPD
jgi:pimeloyl-ACP methyl ester carboxylesterase